MSVTWHPGMTIDQLEREVIMWSVKYWDNKREKVAASLGICIKTLYNKLEKYAADDKDSVGTSLEEQRIADYNKRSGFKVGMYDIRPEDTAADEARQRDYLKRSGFNTEHGHDPELAAQAEKAKVEAAAATAKRLAEKARQALEAESQKRKAKPDEDRRAPAR